MHVPTLVPGLDGYCVQQVTCSQGATIALALGGKLLTWGKSASGVLGQAGAVTSYSPTLLQKFHVIGMCCREILFQSIAAGPYHCAAISVGVILALSASRTQHSPLGASAGDRVRGIMQLSHVTFSPTMCAHLSCAQPSMSPPIQYTYSGVLYWLARSTSGIQTYAKGIQLLTTFAAFVKHGHRHGPMPHGAGVRQCHGS
jgi:hypothetical protein